jgi:hypothetical protein
MNSDDEHSKKEEHGEELTGCFVGGCASLADARMTEQQAQELRASANFSSSLTFQPPQSTEPERKSTPLGTPVNSDEEDLSWDQQRAANLGKRMAGKKKAPPRSATRTSEPEIQPPAKAAPVMIVKPSAVPTADLPEAFKKAINDPKAAAFP